MIVVFEGLQTHSPAANVEDFALGRTYLQVPRAFRLCLYLCRGILQATCRRKVRPSIEYLLNVRTIAFTACGSCDLQRREFGLAPFLLRVVADQALNSSW